MPTFLRYAQNEGINLDRLIIWEDNVVREELTLTFAMGSQPLDVTLRNAKRVVMLRYFKAVAMLAQGLMAPEKDSDVSPDRERLPPPGQRPPTSKEKEQ